MWLRTSGDAASASENVASASENVASVFENVPGVFETVASVFENVAGASEYVPGVFENAASVFESSSSGSALSLRAYTHVHTHSFVRSLARAFAVAAVRMWEFAQPQVKNLYKFVTLCKAHVARFPTSFKRFDGPMGGYGRQWAAMGGYERPWAAMGGYSVLGKTTSPLLQSSRTLLKNNDSHELFSKLFTECTSVPFEKGLASPEIVQICFKNCFTGSCFIDFAAKS